MTGQSDEFTLWDLKVEVVAGEGEMVCNHRVGDYFELSGESLKRTPKPWSADHPAADDDYLGLGWKFSLSGVVGQCKPPMEREVLVQLIQFVRGVRVRFG